MSSLCSGVGGKCLLTHVWCQHFSQSDYVANINISDKSAVAARLSLVTDMTNGSVLRSLCGKARKVLIKSNCLIGACSKCAGAAENQLFAQGHHVIFSDIRIGDLCEVAICET